MDAHEALRKYHLFHYYTQWYSPHSYSIDEAANALGTTAESILNYIAANELAAEPMGSSYRIAVDDLEDFLLTRSQGIVLRRERRCIPI